MQIGTVTTLIWASPCQIRELVTTLHINTLCTSLTTKFNEKPGSSSACFFMQKGMLQEGEIIGGLSINLH